MLVDVALRFDENGLMRNLDAAAFISLRGFGGKGGADLRPGAVPNYQNRPIGKGTHRTGNHLLYGPSIAMNVAW